MGDPADCSGMLWQLKSHSVATELPNVIKSRQENERRWNQTETQIVELQVKLVEVGRAEQQDKVTKLQQETESISQHLDEAELKA